MTARWIVGGGRERESVWRERERERGRKNDEPSRAPPTPTPAPTQQSSQQQQQPSPQTKTKNGRYAGIKKPKWNPPSKLFGPVWGVLYASMGAASWAVSRAAKANKGAAVALYAAQLAFNVRWSI